MGGKSSKAKPNKPNKKAKKSKGRKSKSLDDLSAPEGKYESQATLPRPELSLEGADANLANGAKVEMTVDGDVSIPNADVDLEESGGKLDAKANHAGNNVAATMAEQSGRLSKSLDTGLDQAEDITVDFQTSSQEAADAGVKNVNEISQSIEQKSEQVSENVESGAEKVVDFSENARNSIQVTATDVSGDVEIASADFSRNVEELAKDKSSEVETVLKAPSDVEIATESSHAEQGSHFLGNVEGNVEKAVDDVDQEVNRDIDKAQAVTSDWQNSMEANSEDINRKSENLSANFQENANEAAYEVDSGIADAYETSLARQNSFKEDVDELETTSGNISAEVQAEDIAEEMNSRIQVGEDLSSESQNFIEDRENEVNRVSENVAFSVSENAEAVAQNVDNDLSDAQKMSVEAENSVAIEAESAREIARNSAASAEENTEEFAQDVENSLESANVVSLEVKGPNKADETMEVSENVAVNVAKSEISQEAIDRVETSSQNSQEAIQGEETSPPLSPGRGSVAARIADFNRMSGSKLVTETRRVAHKVSSSPGSPKELSSHKFAQSEDTIVAQNVTNVSSAVQSEVKTVADEPELTEVNGGLVEEVKVNGEVDDTVVEYTATEVADGGHNYRSELSDVENVDAEVDISSPVVPESEAAFVTAYDDFRSQSLKDFLARSKTIGGDVAEIADLVQKGFESQKDFLVMASRSREPSQDQLQGLLKPLSERITAVNDFREQNRKSKYWNHLSAVSEGSGALGWVAVAPKPGPYVKDMKESSLFYSNKVIQASKGVDENQVEWAKSLSKVYDELMAYIKAYHTTGVVWNAQGVPAVVPGASAGGAPPPPPPPPPAVAETQASTGGSSGGDPRTQLFSELNKGEEVTKGLKKVTDDMKTHKNPLLRKGPAPFKVTKVGSSPVTSPKPKAAPKPPRIELEAEKKWIVEYHVGNQDIKIEQTKPKQVVYVFRCENSVVQVKGKVNSVIVDSCKKVGVVVQDVISTVEFVNCQSVKGQLEGVTPTVSIDKTDGCMVYLNDKSINANIVTAKSSEMNVLVVKPDGDLSEYPLPEQFKTTWNGKGWVTEATDIAG